jgi:hypothetical protein
MQHQIRIDLLIPLVHLYTVTLGYEYVPPSSLNDAQA